MKKSIALHAAFCLLISDSDSLLLPGRARALRSCVLLTNASRLAAQSAQVVELGAAYATTLDDINVINDRRV